MRTADLPVAPLAPHPIPPDAPIAAWPAALRIALLADAGTPYSWDQGAVYDDVLVWDTPTGAAEWVDAVCDFQAVQINHAAPDDLGLFGASELVMSLDDRAGVWATWTPAGRLAAFPIGTPVQVWSHYQGEDRWLFAGYVTRWHQVGDAVEVTAYDGFAILAPDWGQPWTPGGPGERPAQRLATIATTAGFPGTLTADAGLNTLAAPTLDPTVSPLEAMQQVALSDGGVIACDPDGRVVFRDRHWRDGRPDQPRVWLFTDNACDSGALVVWDPVAGADDTGLTTEVRLVNVDGLTATATTPGVVPLRLTHPTPDLWQTVPDGVTLANWLLVNGNAAGYRVDSFDLHLTDPNQPGLWAAALDVRRGDRLAWTTNIVGPTGAAVLDVDLIVVGVEHQITPADWTTSITTSRVVASRAVIAWDATTYGWDSPQPDATWRS